MPTYDYLCENCGNIVHIFKKINDPHATQCPSCHEHSLVRTFNSAPGVEFKGKGWFKTDGKY